MKWKMRRLLIQGLEGSSEAFFQLGMLLTQGRGCRRDRRLGGLFLEKAAAMGHEDAYFCYHQFFSQEEKIVDDESYQEMLREYRKAGTRKERRQLEKYLRLGTREQRGRQTAGWNEAGKEKKQIWPVRKRKSRQRRKSDGEEVR